MHLVTSLALFPEDTKSDRENNIHSTIPIVSETDSKMNKKKLVMIYLNISEIQIQKYM